MQPWLSWNLQCRPCWLGTHDVDPGSLEFMEIYLPRSLDSARSWEVPWSGATSREVPLTTSSRGREQKGKEGRGEKRIKSSLQ